MADLFHLFSYKGGYQATDLIMKLKLQLTFRITFEQLQTGVNQKNKVLIWVLVEQFEEKNASKCLIPRRL